MWSGHLDSFPGGVGFLLIGNEWPRFFSEAVEKMSFFLKRMQSGGLRW